MDQITNVSQKAFLLEGGLADSFGLGPGGNNNGGDSSHTLKVYQMVVTYHLIIYGKTLNITD
jgi:hypothetical protein